MFTKSSSCLSILLFLVLAVSSCLPSRNNNSGNRPSDNAVPEATTPATPTPTPPDEEANVKKLIFDLSSALTRGDVDVLENTYSDGFIMITASGAISTKPEQIEMIRSGELKFDMMSFEEVSVRAYGNTAVAMALAEGIQSYQGKSQSMEARVTFVAVKEGDTWRFVSFQFTPTRSEPKAGNSKNSNGDVRSLPSNGVPNSNRANQ
jgi:ketosteroid isomerase-like protein